MSENQNNTVGSNTSLESQKRQLELFRRGLLSARCVALALTPPLLDHLNKSLTGYEWEEIRDHHERKLKKKSLRPKNLWKSNN